MREARGWRLRDLFWRIFASRIFIPWLVRSLGELKNKQHDSHDGDEPEQGKAATPVPAKNHRGKDARCNGRQNREICHIFSSFRADSNFNPDLSYKFFFVHWSMRSSACCRFSSELTPLKRGETSANWPKG